MKRYHELGMVIVKGRCYVALYDVMSHTVQVLHSLEYKEIKDERVPEHVVEEAHKDWEGKI